MKKALDFTLPGSNGKNITLSDFRGKNVVLYFYPKDNTPGCSTEACDFKIAHSNFKDSDTVILGISKDTMARHLKFIDKFDLPFILLSDSEGQVCEDYGVWKLKKMAGREYTGIERSTFLIDKDGNIVKEWCKVRVKGHVEEVTEYLENLK